MIFRFYLGFITLFWAMTNVMAQNSSFFENDIRFYNNFNRITLTHYGEHSLSERFGIADYVFVTNDWGELTVGPYFKINSNFLVAVLPGIETTNNFRLGFYSYYKLNKLTTISAFYEWGLVDYFDFQIRNDHKVLTYMLRLRQDYGLGIPIGVKINKFQLFYTNFYNIEQIGNHKWLSTISFNIQL